MSDQMTIITVTVLALIFFGLWQFNTARERKFKEKKRQTRLQRERRQLKAHPKSKLETE